MLASIISAVMNSLVPILIQAIVNAILGNTNWPTLSS